MTTAKVDRMTVSNMTAVQVHEKLMRALENDRLTASASHDLDYAQDLMEALDEELAEHRANRSSMSEGPTTIPIDGDDLMKLTRLAFHWNCSPQEALKQSLASSLADTSTRACDCNCGCEPDGLWHFEGGPGCACVALNCSCVTDEAGAGMARRSSTPKGGE